MCGGELLKIPCSRIGKILKVSKELYGKDLSENSTKDHLINYNRIVDIWWSKEHQSEFRRLEPDWTKFESKDLEGFYQNMFSFFSKFDRKFQKFQFPNLFHFMLQTHFISIFCNDQGSCTRNQATSDCWSVQGSEFREKSLSLFLSVWFPYAMNSISHIERLL